LVLRSSLSGEELDVELFALLGLKHPSGLFISHWWELGTSVFLFVLVTLSSARWVRSNLLILAFRELVLWDGSPDRELRDWGTLSTCRRSSLD